MLLRLLEVSRFRNLAEQAIAFNENVTLITGANGQGKTSVLEAVYLLAHARSFRTAKTQELIQWGASQRPGDNAPSASVRAEAQSSDGIKELRCELRGSKKTVFLNGNRLTAASEFYGQLRCVVFTPDDLDLVKGAPSLRRRFIDSLLAMSNPGYVDGLVNYQRALRNRNSLLLRFKREGQTALETVGKSLAPWDALLIANGRSVAAARSALCRRLRQEVSGHYREMSGLGNTAESSGNIAVSADYHSQFLSAGGDISSESEILAEYQRRIPIDLQRQATTFGIHRDDLLLNISTAVGVKPARMFTSQGQARSIALALKICAVDYLRATAQDPPILLLDDVESELDARRTAALYRLLSAWHSQIIITATDRSEVFARSLPEADVKVVEKGLFNA